MYKSSGQVNKYVAENRAGFAAFQSALLQSQRRFFISAANRPAR
jgi:hypothetical protein